MRDVLYDCLLAEDFTGISSRYQVDIPVYLFMYEERREHIRTGIYKYSAVFITNKNVLVIIIRHTQEKKYLVKTFSPLLKTIMKFFSIGVVLYFNHFSFHVINVSKKFPFHVMFHTREQKKSNGAR